MSVPEGFHLNPAPRVCPIDRTLQPTPLPSFLCTYIPKVRKTWQYETQLRCPSEASHKHGCEPDGMILNEVNFLKTNNTGFSLRVGYWANWAAVRLILPAWFDLEENFFFFIKKFSLKRFAYLRKTVAVLLKTLMKFLEQVSALWYTTPESNQILCPSSRWPQGRMSIAAVIVVLLTRFRAYCRGVLTCAGTSYCTARLTFKTCNMPSNTFSLRLWVEWKEPLPRMDGPSYKFQVCWSTSYSVRVLSDILIHLAEQLPFWQGQIFSVIYH